MALNPNEIISQKESTKPDPNEPRRKIIVTTVTRRNGTVELWTRAETDTPDQGVKTSSYVDDDLRKQFESDRKAEADEAKAAKADAPKGPQVETLPSGEKIQYDPASGKWVPLPGVEQTPKTTAAERPTVVPASAADKTSRFIVQQMPDGNVRRVPNPNYDPAAAANERQAEKRALTAAEIRDEAARLDMLVKQKKMTDDQRDREFDEWYKGRSLEHQERQAALAEQREKRLETSQERQFERQSTQDERRAKLDEDTLGYNRTKAAYDVGQDTVRNAMAMLPYRVGPGFAKNFAAGVNTLAKGGGAVNFSPEDFTFQAPDLDALREQSMQRALSAFQGSTPPAYQPGVAPSGADLMAPPPSPLVNPAAAVGPYIPPQRRQMPY